MFSLRKRKIDFMVRGIVAAAFLHFLAIAALAQNQPAGAALNQQ
jgi:hypothetical protein